MGETQETDGSSRRLTIDELALTSTAESESTAQGPKEFLFAWFQLFRTAQIHSLENQAIRRPVQNFIEITNNILTSEGNVSFQGKDGAFFVNSVKVNLSSDEYAEAAEPINEFFEERGMGGFVIGGNFDTEGVHELLSILVYAPPNERRFVTITTKLQGAGLHFRINKALRVRKSKDSEVLERRAYSFFTYSKLVTLFRGLLAESENDAKRNYLIRKIGRSVEALVDICMEDDHTFLGVSSVKSEEAYAPHHGANVAVLSIALGEKLGLSKVDLADLGMAAVFSDIGMKDVPLAVIEKGDTLEPPERASLERHTLQSVKFLLGDKRYTKPLVRRILVALEHHRHVDGGGFPRLSHRPDLFSRIVSIADTYDSLTTDRQWRKAHLPDEALGIMLADSGKKFDPLLLKIFINTMGLYPIGTLVRLTTGELAVVIYSGGDPERTTHPVVALLDSEGKPGQSVDLTEKDTSGKYLREIASAEDPSKYGLQASGLLSNSPAS
jgi:HD-GYP domain-containing protein (c-di-GMP phosphodiesterase class II)